MRQNGPKTAGKRAQNGGRGSEWAAALLKLVSKGSCAGRSHWAGRKLGVLGRFWGEFLSIFFGKFRARSPDRHVTAT